MYDHTPDPEAFDRSFKAAEPALQEAFRLLLIAANLSDEPLAPTEALDELLHDLLDSPRALAEVEASLGCRLIHTPGLTGPPLEAAFARTVAMFAALEGQTVAVCGLEGQTVAVCGLEGQTVAVCGLEGQTVAVCGLEGQTVAVCGLEGQLAEDRPSCVPVAF